MTTQIYSFTCVKFGFSPEGRMQIWGGGSKNRVLRKIYGCKKGEVAGEWRSLHNKEHHNLYSSNNIRVTKSRKIRWARRAARVSTMSTESDILVPRPQGRGRPLWGSTRRWKDNIKMYLKERVWGRMKWIQVALDKSGDWKRMQNEELRNLYASPNILG
jgi:hypothetical protein